MSLQEFQGFKAPRIEPERALRMGLGAAAAPLWSAFFVAAGAGAAYWWMTSWTRRPVTAEPVSFLPSPEPEVEAPALQAAPVEAAAIEPAPVHAAAIEPEEVMAHQPTEDASLSPPADPGAEDLTVAPEAVMEHALPAAEPQVVTSAPIAEAAPAFEATPAVEPEPAPPASPSEAVTAAVGAIAAATLAPKSAKVRTGARRKGPPAAKA